MKIVYLSFLLFLFSFSSLKAQDAEELKPEKYTGVDWYEFVYVDFEAGSMDKVVEIMGKLNKAAKTAGTDAPKIYRLVTGKYDVMLEWKLKDGPAELEWKRTKDGIKWWQALIEQEGGEDKAKALMAEYRGYVVENYSVIARDLD